MMAQGRSKINPADLFTSVDCNA